MAGFKARKTVLLGHLETRVDGDLAYGSTATPVVTSLSGADAVQVIDPSVDPIIGDYKDLGYVRDVMGNSPRIQASRHVGMSFKTPFSGISAPSGTVPAWGQYLRMCGFAETTDTYWTTYRVVSLAAAIGATTVKLTNVDDLVVGDAVAASSLAGSVAGGTTISAINTTTKVVTLSAGLTLGLAKGDNLRFRRSTIAVTTSAESASGADTLTMSSVATLQVGMGVSGTNIPSGTYAEGISQTTNVVRLSKALTGTVSNGATITFDYKRTYYNTVSEDHEYGTLQMYLDKIMHKATGARGTVKISGSAGELPMLDFQFKGLYSTPTDASPTSVVYTAWKDPTPVNARNTAISYAGENLNVSRFELDIGNELVYRNLVNAEDVQIVDRKCSGALSWECDAIAAQDWFDHVNTGATGALYFKHGPEGGQYVEIHADAMAMHDLKYEVVDGVYFFSATLAFVPNSGNDDIVIQAY